MLITSSKGKNDTYGDWWKSVLDDEDKANIDKIWVSSKMNVLFHIIGECDRSQECLLIFSQSTEVLETVQFFLDGGGWKNSVNYYCLTGNTPTKIREKICKAFSANGEKDVAFKDARLLLATTTAGGVGLNLVRANRIVILDPSWNHAIDVSN